MGFQKIFAGNLARIMDDQRLTKKDVAAAIGVSRQMVSEYLREQGFPAPAKIDALAAALNVDLTDLVLDDQDREDLAVGRRIRRDPAWSRLVMAMKGAPAGRIRRVAELLEDMG